MTATMAPRYAPVEATCIGGYGRTLHRVLAHVDHDDWRGASVLVQTLSGPQRGRVHEHSTPFDWRRDRVLFVDSSRAGELLRRRVAAALDRNVSAPTGDQWS
jgi:hypothetical protein